MADGGKKSKTNEVEAAADDQIDAELVLSVEKLQEVQHELEKVNIESSDKCMEAARKYSVIRKPVYTKRNEIIKSIPDFWLTAFLSHPILGDLLNDEDQKTFKSNPYFEGAKLTKTFTFLDDGTTKITGTIIKWKEGMGIANGGNHEKRGNKRPPSDESFFRWFSETQQEIVGVLHNEVADIIRGDLWRNPLRYFNKELDEEDSEGDYEVDSAICIDDEDGKEDDDG